MCSRTFCHTCSHENDSNSSCAGYSHFYASQRNEVNGLREDEREILLADVILGNTITLDRDVPGMMRRLGGRLNTGPVEQGGVELKIKAPPYLNSTGPLYEDGNGDKYNTVMGFTQTDIKGKDGKWAKNPNCPHSKVWILYENRRAYPKYLVRYYRGPFDKSRVMFRTREEANSLRSQPYVATRVANPSYEGAQHRRERPSHGLVPKGGEDSAAMNAVTSPRRPVPSVRPEVMLQVRADFQKVQSRS